MGTQMRSEPPSWALAAAGSNQLPGSKQEPPPLPPTQPGQEHLRTRISRPAGKGSAAFNTDMPVPTSLCPTPVISS